MAAMAESNGSLDPHDTKFEIISLMFIHIFDDVQTFFLVISVLFFVLSAKLKRKSRNQISKSFKFQNIKISKSLNFKILKSQH